MPSQVIQIPLKSEVLAGIGVLESIRAVGILLSVRSALPIGMALRGTDLNGRACVGREHTSMVSHGPRSR